MVVNVSVRESTVVRPAEETPWLSLWISNLDMMQPHIHTPLVYVYKPNNSDGANKDHNFFDMCVLKHSLSKALVPFYPLAGRPKQKSYKNRTEINCNAEGVLFVVADSSSCITDFGDCAPTPEFGRGYSQIPPINKALIRGYVAN